MPATTSATPGNWPRCSNCGDLAKWVGTHPDAGSVPVCEGCVTGQGFKNLRLYEEILKRPMPPPDQKT